MRSQNTPKRLPAAANAIGAVVAEIEAARGIEDEGGLEDEDEAEGEDGPQEPTFGAALAEIEAAGGVEDEGEVEDEGGPEERAFGAALAEIEAGGAPEEDPEGEDEAESERVGEAVRWLNAAVRRHGVALAREVRDYVLDRFFAGSFEAFADPGRGKPLSFRALTARADLAVSRTTLQALVRVGEQVRSMAPAVAEALTIKHHRVLLPVQDAALKADLAARAVREGWSAARLAEVAVEVGAVAPRRVPAARATALSRLRAAQRALPERWDAQALAGLDADAREALEDAVEELELRLEAIRAALAGAEA